MTQENELKNDLLSPSAFILIEQAHLCCRVEIPKSFSEMNTLLWKAFNLGKEYRDKGGTE